MAAEPELPSAARTLPLSIGRYEVVASLGEGGMARVYLALQRGAFDSAKLVVIKQVRPELASDDDFLAMFMDEARIALRLHHPNVIHTYEVMAERPDFCLIMEYLEGQTLLQLLRRTGREAFPLEMHVWVLSQVLAGLHHAHGLIDLDGTPLGIVHRDVSPSNVFVTAAGEVKLLDFGIAKAAGAVSLTQQGIMKGKLGYAAPEQCLAQASDARADIFAVGVMLWEAIAGRRRMSGDTGIAALQARVTDQEPAIETVVADVAPELAELCRRALAFDPEKRFASALEFQQALEKYLEASNSRAGSAALAELMQKQFAPEFTQLRTKVEAQVQEGRRSAARPLLEELRPVEELPSVSRYAVATVGPGKSRSRQLFAGLGVAGLLATAYAFGAGGRRPEATPPQASVHAAVAPSAIPSAAAPPSIALAPTPAPLAKVHVTLVVNPPRAQLLLDGQRVENPFVREVAADDGEHVLEISAAGYKPERHRLAFSRDFRAAPHALARAHQGQGAAHERRAHFEFQPNSGRQPRSDPKRRATRRGLEASAARHPRNRREGPLSMKARSAVLLVATLALPSAAHAAGDGAGIVAASSDVERARAHFERGATLYKENSFDAALAEFSRAYELVPNYRVLYNIGQVQIERHDYVAALKAFEDYLRQGAADVASDRRDQVEREISNLKGRVSEVSVSSNVEGAELSLDGIPVGTLPLKAPLLVSAGVRRLSLNKRGYTSAERTISVAGGDKPEVAFVLEALAPLASETPDVAKHAPATGSNSLGTATWVSIAATGAFAGGAVLFGLVAQSKNDDLDGELARYPANRARVDDARSSVKLYAGLSDGFSAAAVVSAGIAVYCLLSGSSRSEQAAAPRQAQLVPLANGVALRGQF
ncbi:MAG: serine/threonine-protein kinase [Polyangiaceae bacterium]